MKLRMRGPLVTGLVLLLSIAGILFLVTMDHDKLYDDPNALAGSANSYSAVMFVNRQTNGGYSGSVGKLSGIHEVFSLYRSRLIYEAEALGAQNLLRLLK